MNGHGLTIVFSALIVVLALPDGLLYAQGSSEEREAEASAAREMKYDETMSAVETEDKVDGEVVGINVDAGTITVKETTFDNEPYLFVVNKDTSFMGAASLSDMRIGDKVTVDYIYINYKRIIDNIVVGERGPERPSRRGEDALPQLEKVLSD